MRRLYLFGAILFVIFAFYESRSLERGLARPEVFIPYLLACAVVFAGGYWLLVGWLRQTLARLQAQMGSKRDLLLPTTYEFFADHVEVRTSGGTGRIAWSHVLDVVMEEGRIYLLPTRKTAAGGMGACEDMAVASG